MTALLRRFPNLLSRAGAVRLALFAGLALAAAPAFAQDAAGSADLVARGDYLAKAGDCIACHTTPGGKPFAGGLPFKTPMGTIYSPNITPDKATGIGNWTDAEFLRAMHEGIGKDSEHLYPAFPYTSFAKISDGDVAAIKAFLFSLPAVAQQNKPNEMRFPYNMRFLMTGWNLLNFHTGALPDPNTDRGRYLVDGLGHCAECHSPRNATMGLDGSRYLGGGDVDGWTAFNITPSTTSGIGSWSVDDIKTYLKTGNVDGKAQAAGPMAEVVANSTSHMTDDDLTQIANYLKTVPPVEGTGTAGRSTVGSPSPVDAITAFRAAGKSDDEGEQLYVTNCATCHALNGGGVGNGVIPSLFHNSVTGANKANNLALVVLNGVVRGTGFNAASMPAFASQMTDAQVATLTNYVRSKYGNAENPITAAEVRDLRDDVLPPSPVDGMMHIGIGIAIAVIVVIIAALLLWGMRRRHPMPA